MLRIKSVPSLKKEGKLYKSFTNVSLAVGTTKQSSMF